MEDTPTPDPLTKLYLMTIVWECADSARRGSAVSGTLLKFQVQPLSFREALREIYWKCLILALGTIHNTYVLFFFFFFFFTETLVYKEEKKNIFKLLRALPSSLPPFFLPFPLSSSYISFVDDCGPLCSRNVDTWMIKTEMAPALMELKRSRIYHSETCALAYRLLWIKVA